jgi:hypothetical protein
MHVRLRNGLVRTLALPLAQNGWNKYMTAPEVPTETGEGKVSEEWVGETLAFGLGILPWPPERLCAQKTWSFAY